MAVLIYKIIEKIAITGHISRYAVVKSHTVQSQQTMPAVV